MKTRQVLFIGAILLLAAAPLLLADGLLWSALPGTAQTLLLDAIAPQGGLVGLLSLLAAFLVGVLAHAVWRHYPGALWRLVDGVKLIVGPNPAYRPPAEGAAEVRALVAAVAELAEQRDTARRDVAAQVERSRASLETERNRLAALVAELPLPIVVCNLDGRILLYNNRARLQARAFAPADAATGALIGLGRSIHGVFDRSLIAHALETIRHRLEREGSQPLAHFITTTRAGQLIRVQMAPVLGAAGEGAEGARSIGGYVLVLENITRTLESGAQCDRAVQTLTNDARSALAGIRASLQGLRDAGLPEKVQAAADAIEDEVQILNVRLNQSAEEYARTLVSRWPLEEMLGTDLVTAVGRRIESRIGVKVKVDAVAEGTWVKVDSYSLTQAFSFLASKLDESYGVRLVRLCLVRMARMAYLELRWSGTAVSTEILLGWQIDPMTVGGEDNPLTLRDVTERHGGQLSCGRESALQQSFFRIEIPLATALDEGDLDSLVHVESRPEFYDFDLFNRAGEDHASDETRLADLSYTVFDTETTGLEPSAGDEIIQIGAVRIVNGRLLRHENIDQLVDPCRPLRPEGIPIHGITEDMVRGQPTIAAALPRFHAFCAGTVLVAHNAAFDMRFLQLKETALGIRFTQPVLDTLLLSAVIHPNQESHKLEAIAERLGITIIGRHTALGDAIVTAEVFLRMLPLLADMGIHTLGEARAASEKTYYARIRY